MSQLSSAEKELFQQAKQKEIESWLSTETVAKVLRHQIPEENILQCRWILTWKPLDDAKADQPKHVPKARLVVLGYEDPLVHEIPRDSPTMSKLPRMLILQLAASKGCDIESFKTAFLRGQEQGDRIPSIEPAAELREKMKLRPNEVLRLLKGAGLWKSRCTLPMVHGSQAWTGIVGFHTKSIQSVCFHFGKSRIWHYRGHCWGPCR